MKKIKAAGRTRNVRHANRDLVPFAEEVEKAGKKVLYLNIGDPIKYGFRSPEHLWQAVNARREECEGYTNALGSDGARKAVANYANRKGARITKDDVIIFAGGSEAIILSLQALLNQDENILTPKPGYSVYNGELNFLGCEINEYDSIEEEDWRVDIDAMRKAINKKTKAIALINPNNPTGAVLSKKNLEEIVGIAGEHSLPIISDETYDELVFGEEEFTPIVKVAKELPVMSLSGISKSFLAPGFRGGWIYKQDPQGVLDDYYEGLKKLCRLRLTNVGLAQVAIEAALNGPKEHIKETVETLRKRRDITYKRLNEIQGLSCTKPPATFYTFPKIGFKVKSDKDFVIELLRETGVLLVHGEGFGQRKGTHHFRMVFLPPEETLYNCFDLIEKFIKKRYD